MASEAFKSYKFSYQMFLNKVGKNVSWLIQDGKVVRPIKLVLKLNKANVEINAEVLGVGKNVNISLINDVFFTDDNGILMIDLDSRQFGSDAVLGLSGFIRSDSPLVIEMVNVIIEGGLHEIDEEQSNTIAITSFMLNNGDIFSETQTVIATWQTNFTATEYRISKLDSFADTVWKANTGSCEFELYQIGVNKVYLQVRNSEQESNIVSTMIGWHGMEQASCSDDVRFASVVITDEIAYDKLAPTVSSIADSVTFPVIAIDDDVAIYINDIQVYPSEEGQ